MDENRNKNSETSNGSTNGSKGGHTSKSISGCRNLSASRSRNRR